MITKLTPHGDGFALVLDNEVLELLDIDPETPVEISIEGGALIVSPVRDEERRERFSRSLEKVNNKYGRMLKRLAE